MENEILTDYVVLHIHNQKIPALTIKEADTYLLSEACKLESDQHLSVNLELVFTDGVKLIEAFSISKSDSLIDNIIRYHMVGIIRYKAGLLTSTSVDAAEYKKNLENVDTDFYKKLYANYSFFYSIRKNRSIHKHTNDLDKLQHKYKKLILRESKKINAIQNQLKSYEGTLFGLNTPPENVKTVKSQNESKLILLRAGTKEYHYVSGILEGIKLLEKIVE